MTNSDTAYIFGDNPSSSRRHILSRSGLGLLGLSFLSLLNDNDALCSDIVTPNNKTHFNPKAKRVIQIFAVGGPSHVDTFDPKPSLEKYHGQKADQVIKNYQKDAGEAAAGMGRLGGTLYRSGFKFNKYGQSGLEISELFPLLSEHADDLCVIRSMSTNTSVHEPAEMMMNTGSFSSIRPSLGSWTIYGLGSENTNLPGFISFGGNAKTCASAFLPASCSATTIHGNNFEVEKILEHIRSQNVSLREQRRQINLLHSLHSDFMKKHHGDSLLNGRMSAFETAFRMQIESLDAFDIEKERMKTRAMYGDSHLGKQLLLARRLSEHGVRFVQVLHGGWDTHDLNDEGHRKLAGACDGPLAALLTDLKQKDMLKDTLVIWGGEFGRTPTTEINTPNKRGVGRDHNAGGFSIWMAGGGVKGGYVHGATDDFGALAIQDKMDNHDLHATILHLLGFDHTKLTFRYSGRDFRLTDVHGNVAKNIIL